MTRRGIILAGGAGTRLHPLTAAVSKQLMPVYSKPMIYYPLTVLMLAGIREILVITTPEDGPAFRRLLGDGAGWGIQITYAVQPRPEGLAQAYVVGAEFVQGEPSALILGDNLFFGQGFPNRLAAVSARREGATVFATRVSDPERYGVVSFDAEGRAETIEEKPLAPRSPYAVVGLYFYDGRAPELAAALPRGPRGEYEITDLNRRYLEDGRLAVETLGRGTAWLDTGTPDSLLQAANFVQAIEQRQGTMVACPEEVAFEQGWIDAEGVLAASRPLEKTEYGRYLRALAESGPHV